MFQIISVYYSCQLNLCGPNKACVLKQLFQSVTCEIIYLGFNENAIQRSRVTCLFSNATLLSNAFKSIRYMCSHPDKTTYLQLTWEYGFLRWVIGKKF